MSGEFSDYGFAPGYPWWREVPLAGFLARGDFPGGFDATAEQGASYGTAARIRSFGGGAWHGGATGGKATVAFPKDGTYDVEFVGMGPQGGMTPKTVKVTVTSRAKGP